MRFTPLPLAGAFKIELERIADDRGFFARCWCSREFAEHGLSARLEQCSLSYNSRRGTLRGLHYQCQPHPEIKIVRCVSGRVFDVIADVRSGSPTFMRWHAVELSADNRIALYIPEGFAHGFLTLEDGSELLYQMSGTYHPECARGIHWDSGALAIKWPFRDGLLMSEKDRSLPDQPC
jgi:dTDP-4-dehydrorhamnose 3,5-epimerase